MEVRGANVFAFALLLIALVAAFKMRHEIGAFFSTMGHIGPGHTPDEQVTGLIAAGLIGVLIVAIVKILTSGRKGS
jgi:hypothetical protein